LKTVTSPALAVISNAKFSFNEDNYYFKLATRLIRDFFYG